MKSMIWIGGLAGTLLLAGAASAQNCSGQLALFTCSGSSSSGSGPTTCSPTSAVSEFTILDVLSAAQGCDPTIDEDTPMLIVAAGGSGGEGGSSAAAGGHAGAGGYAVQGATIGGYIGLNGADRTYCYGIGGQASHSGDNGGAGGAASILRFCDPGSQVVSDVTVVVAGGGGGGGSGGFATSGNTGGAGGIAISGTAGVCPPSCATGSTANGAGGLGHGNPAGNGGSSGVGGGSPTNGGGDGVGGVGGGASVGGAGFIQGQPQVTGSSGAGGTALVGGGGGGGGGGGYGGGGAGGTGEDQQGNGGGGGGSFANRSLLPFKAEPGGEGGDGYLNFAFNVPEIPAFTPKGDIGGTNNGDSCWDTQNLPVLGIGDYQLDWQPDGNLVLYQGETARWASNTSGNPGAQLCWQLDGNLVIYNAAGAAIWASNTADAEHGGDGGLWLTLYQDGTLEIVNGSGVALWNP